VVGPSTDRPEVANVRVTGLHLDGIFHDGVGIFVDRVQSFAIRHNVFERLAVGTRSRGSSGSWSHNFSTTSGQAAVLTGGSATYPAALRVLGNRSSGNDLLGLLLNPTGSYGIALDFGQSGLMSAPIQTVFDLDDVEDRRNVPDALLADVIDNDFSDNGFIGLRLFEIGIRTNTYTTVSLDQPIDAHLDVHISGNTFEHNGFGVGQTVGYGVSLDGGFSNRNVNGLAQPDYTGDFELAFSDNVFSSNRRASLWAGFTRFGNNATFKPLRGARIEIVEDVPLDALYDNPQCDPFDPSNMPLANELLVNGIPVPPNAPICVP